MAQQRTDDDRGLDPGELSSAPLVRTEQGLGRPGHPVTAVFLHGEHDVGCRELLGDALAQLHCDVLVDLSWCTFADSSIIASIIAKHGELEREGHRLEVIVPPSHSQLSRAFDRLGARGLLPVRDAPPPANGSERRAPG